ncbi:hypothetical protein GGH94_002980 [Coemansia aciculifera]|uniref:Uncharacterized protein n=1 Tax=Coemansia aciculifera TaxID=417176 RepID=A0A9W8IRC7_9FUNG|nr:hypothetical protein GGH94_002980 [Coemansia aciculifera]KAJ2873812.1 hypothetical protein GGH93_002905 [Coemansia aciculifera]
MSTFTTTMSPEQRVSMAFELLQAGSKKEYIGGEMTQLDHALQAAQLVKNEGADEETVLAALTRDIGFQIPVKDIMGLTGDNYYIFYTITDRAGNTSAVDHDRVGAAYLRKLGFSKKTCELIESDVLAKRYLSTIAPVYQESLNNASRELLKLQGGPLSSTEMREFEKDPLFKQKVQFRKWNDAARTTGVKPPALDAYRDMATRNVLMSMRTPY